MASNIISVRNNPRHQTYNLIHQTHIWNNRTSHVTGCHQKQHVKQTSLDCFLEDPSNVVYIEGEDAILTCKISPTSLPVEWLKDGNAVKLNENCEQSNEGTEHRLVIKNVTSDDSGKYCVKVGHFSRKIHL
ncbi:Hypothetical predicted protein [Mytilus galloprovincialis]|uniref:Ig-like domain-containing protein n=1 Tax=Mytilus galloprovincialis TaxID=29158 RepID=A0A8B6FS19_MYTGA|nr:Hypothetical predicted protein [Mytilus galloprovincialis]